MKIKLRTAMGTNGKSYKPGDVAEWDDADAQRLIAAAKAELVQEVIEVEAAAVVPPENAARRPGRPRKG